MAIITPDGQTASSSADYKASAKELCQALLDDPQLKGVFSAVDDFMANEEAKGLFTEMQSKGESLQMKQQAGLELTAGEVEEYNKARDAMLDNPAAKAFVDAQGKIQSVHETVGSWVSLVFELGRMPTEEEFDPAVDTTPLKEKAGELETGFQHGEVFSTSRRLNHCLRLCFAHYNEEDIREGIARMRPLFD